MIIESLNEPYVNRSVYSQNLITGARINMVYVQLDILVIVGVGHFSAWLKWQCVAGGSGRGAENETP